MQIKLSDEEHKILWDILQDWEIEGSGERMERMDKAEIFLEKLRELRPQLKPR